MNRTKWKVAVEAVDKVTSVISTIGTTVRGIAGKVWNVTVSIIDKVTAPEKLLIKKEELMEVLEKEQLDVLVTFGAGNIDRFIGPITQMLEKRI